MLYACRVRLYVLSLLWYCISTESRLYHIGSPLYSFWMQCCTKYCAEFGSFSSHYKFNPLEIVFGNNHFSFCFFPWLTRILSNLILVLNNSPFRYKLMWSSDWKLQLSLFSLSREGGGEKFVCDACVYTHKARWWRPPVKPMTTLRLTTWTEIVIEKVKLMLFYRWKLLLPVQVRVIDTVKCSSLIY